MGIMDVTKSRVLTETLTERFSSFVSLEFYQSFFLNKEQQKPGSSMLVLICSTCNIYLKLELHNTRAFWSFTDSIFLLSEEFLREYTDENIMTKSA